MKRKKKASIIILIVVLLLCFVVSICIAIFFKSSKEVKPSEGLEYTFDEEENHYVITGIGSCEDEHIVIDSIYNGKPVMAIGKEAFRGCNTITSIVILNGVTTVEDYAFAFCRNLKNINLGNDVTSIGLCAFAACGNLLEINFAEKLEFIGERAFYGCSSLAHISVAENNLNYKSVGGNLYTKDGRKLVQYAIGKNETIFVIPDEVQYIGEYSISGCARLTRIELRKNVKCIGEGAFKYCNALSSVIISNSVTIMGKYLFGGCSSLTSIAFSGTVEEWNKIQKITFWGGIPATEIVCLDGTVAL